MVESSNDFMEIFFKQFLNIRKYKSFDYRRRIGQKTSCEKHRPDQKKHFADFEKTTFLVTSILRLLKLVNHPLSHKLFGPKGSIGHPPVQK